MLVVLGRVTGAARAPSRARSATLQLGRRLCRELAGPVAPRRGRRARHTQRPGRELGFERWVLRVGGDLRCVLFESLESLTRSRVGWKAAPLPSRVRLKESSKSDCKPPVDDILESQKRAYTVVGGRCCAASSTSRATRRVQRTVYLRVSVGLLRVKRDECEGFGRSF